MRHFHRLEDALRGVLPVAQQRLTHDEMEVRRAGVRVTGVTGIEVQQISGERIIGG